MAKAQPKKYGLIFPSSKKKGIDPGSLKKPSIFADSSSEEDVSIYVGVNNLGSLY